MGAELGESDYICDGFYNRTCLAFMLPLLGAGVAGLDMNPMMPVITMARHWAYAIPLIFILHQSGTQVSHRKV